MTSFRYKAMGPAGKLVSGAVEAEDAAAAARALRQQGLVPVEPPSAAGEGWIKRLMSLEIGGERGIPPAKLAEVTREIATMLAAGESLDKALRYVVETTSHARTRAVLETIRDKVRGGTALSAALSDPALKFPRVYIGLVKAGEASGALAETMDRLADLLESERELAATVTSSLIYPIILSCVAIGTIVLLIGYVVPQFVPIFQQNGAALPASTQFLVDAGDALGTIGPWLLVLIGLLFLVGRRLLQDEAIRGRVDRFVLRVPVLGGLNREIAAARFCRTLGTMLQNGTPLVAGLQTVRESLSNAAARAAVDKATGVVRGGGSLSRALEDSKVFPLRTLHLVRLGEESGALAQVTLRAAQIHERAVRTAMQRLVSLLVPAITILMGAAVALIIGSLLAALMGLNDLAG